MVPAALTRGLVGLVAAAALLASCGQPAQDPPSQARPGRCEKADLDLVQPGVLTIGTDNPAFPPWFEGGTSKESTWEINDPTTGEGFESAVAYALAEELGFPEEEVEWVEVPFGQSFKPGPKDFDFDINQISYRPARDQAVDFSDSYYDVNQSLIAVEDNPITDATTLEELRAFKLAAPVGTTSFEYIETNIQPTEDPAVYDTLNDSISALQNGQVDGVVLDLPGAFYATAVQVDDGVIVGQFPTVGEQEYFGLVFEEGSSLVACVNEALAALQEDETLQDIQEQWLSQNVQVPVLT
jgi:polar amino acid transport system substrate-binding protein